MDVIIYGLGSASEFVESRLSKDNHVIGYTDSYANITIFKGENFIKLSELNKVRFDYIIITIRNRKTAWEIYNMLVSIYNIPKDKVIPYFVYAESENYKIKFGYLGDKKIEGLIFGNSLAKFGILTDYLTIPFLNLAVICQDIYFNYRTFQLCKEMYAHYLHNLRYIIIDLYDYQIFNWDLSLCRNFMNYPERGGLLEEHHYMSNINYHNKISFEEDVFNIHHLLVDKQSISKTMSTLFGNKGMLEDTCYEEKRWNCIKRTEPLGTGPLVSSRVMKRHEDTIIENRNCLELFLKDIKRYNPSIQIVFTMLPMFITMELASRPLLELWKQEFEEIINDLCIRYNVKFLNYKNQENISSNNNFYFDTVHMNRIGGKCLTSILNEDLKKI